MAWDSRKCRLIQNNGINEKFYSFAAVEKLYILLLMLNLSELWRKLMLVCDV